MLTACGICIIFNLNTMTALNVYAILMIVFGLSVTIANIIAVVILFKCKKMVFQIRTWSIQLAITDILTGVLITMNGLHITDFAFAICCAIFHIQVVVSNMTCFTITAITFDRFLALCFPLRYRYIVTARRVKYTVVVLWTIAVTLSLLALLWMKNEHVYDLQICVHFWRWVQATCDSCVIFDAFEHLVLH